MKRPVKNLILFGVMLAALGMTALTVLHGYGIIGTRWDGNGAAVGMPGSGQMSQRPDGDGNRGDGGDGEVIGEITLPEAKIQGDNPDGGQNLPQAPDGNGQTPPQMPGGGFDGAQPGGQPNAGAAGAGSLGAHLAFASAWIFVFAFCLAWAILSRCNRRKEKESWQQAPVSNGTN